MHNANLQPALLKPLLRAISTLVALQSERVAGTLDAAGLALVNQAEKVLAAQSARMVSGAWLAWHSGGQPTVDPRERDVLIMEREKLPSGRQSPSAFVQRSGVRGDR